MHTEENPLYIIEMLSFNEATDKLETKFYSLEAINTYDAKLIAQEMYHGKIVNIAEIAN